MSRPGVAITGIGLVTPLGLSAPESLERLLSGESAIGPLGCLDVTGHACKAAATVAEFDITPSLRIPKNQKFMSPGVKFLMRGAREAIANAGVDLAAVDAERIALYTGSGHAGPEAAEFFPALALSAEETGEPDWNKMGGRPSRLIDPYFPLRTLSNAGIGLLSADLGARGPGSNFVQTSTASALAIAAACDDLAENRCDLALAGGYDSLVTVSSYLAHEKEGLLSALPPEEAHRPFDRDRDGIVLGEGAGVVALERWETARARGAPVLGEIAGFGTALDVSDSLQPRETGGFIPVIEEQLRELGSADVVVAHGIGTREGDRREAVMLSSVFGRAVPVTAFKGYTGFLGAATAMVEVCLGLLALRSGRIPAIARCPNPDSEFSLDLVVGPTRAAAGRTPAALFLDWSWTGQLTALSIRAV